MVDNLKDIFDNINNWLKFAEAKNGAIIALNSALIFGILKLNSSITNQNILLNYYISIGIFLLFVSIIMALLSFIPRLNYPYIIFDKPTENDNLLYFGDILKYTPLTYYEKLQIKTCGESNKKDFEMYYINQIIINSKITFIKFKQFEIAVWFTLSAFLTPIGGLLLYFVRKIEL